MSLRATRSAGSGLEFVCREHRSSTFLRGPDRPEPSVVAAVLFFVGPPCDAKGTGGTRGRIMRRMRREVDRAVLPVCERIVQCYCPYVLVRCTRYTNQRRQAQQIGAYTLVMACLTAREVGPALSLGRIVEAMLRVVGPDVLAGAEGEDWRQGCTEPLLVDPWMRHTALALNALKRPGREVLVLHHVGGIGPEDLAVLLGQPAGEVLARLGRAERRLARWLGVPHGRPVLARFAAGLDRGWIQEVTAYAMEYLVASARRAEGWKTPRVDL
jgi:DNA-directed RNA polymerase specialized sigma24 family protein